MSIPTFVKIRLTNQVNLILGDVTQTVDVVLEDTQGVVDGLTSGDPLGGTLDATGDLLSTTIGGVEDILELNEGEYYSLKILSSLV